MKSLRSYFTTLLTLLTLGFLATAYAQNHDTSMQSAGRQGRGMMPSTDDRLEHLSQILNLSDDQKAKVRPMLDDEANRMQSVWQDDSTPRDQKQEKLQQVHQQAVEQVKTVLTVDQLKKFQDMQAHTKQRMSDRHGPDDGSKQ